MQTVSEGLSVGTVITFYDVDLVIKSLLITSAVFLVLTGYTMQSKYDFSTWGARYRVWLAIPFCLTIHVLLLSLACSPSCGYWSSVE